MDSSSKARAELIRRGNQAFNAKDFRLARELFIQAGYKGGLTRLGDYYMYEKSLPLLAYGYYKRAGASAKMEDIHRRMIAAIAEWIGHDKLRPESIEAFTSGQKKKPEYRVDQDGMIPVSVDPTLRQRARAILAKSNGHSA